MITPRYELFESDRRFMVAVFIPQPKGEEHFVTYAFASTADEAQERAEAAWQKIRTTHEKNHQPDGRTGPMKKLNRALDELSALVAEINSN